MSIATTSAAALRVHLSYLRSAALVGHALADTFHSEDAWLAFLSEPDVAATFQNFARFVNDIRGMVDTGAVIDFAELEALGAQHYAHGLEAVEVLAERLEIAPQDLLVTLLYG